MKIVFITIPGAAKDAFAHTLAQDPAVDLQLIIRQQRIWRSRKRWQHIYAERGLKELGQELVAAVRLRLSPTYRYCLRYFTHPTATATVPDLTTPVIEVNSINDDAVYQKLQEIAPDLLVVWGSGMIDDRIIRTAKRAINLHLGLCPHYRGALANQLAVLHGDYAQIGATIHELSDRPDAGAILATVTPEVRQPPQALFADLHTRATSCYHSIINQLASGTEIPGTPQDLQVGKELRLRDWTPRKRLAVAQTIAAWERARVPTAEAHPCAAGPK